MPAPEVVTAVILKAVGSIVGAVLAVLFRWPKTKREAQKRIAFSLLAGITLTPVAIPMMRTFLDIENNAETIVAVATITAFASWFCAGPFLKFFDRWGNPNP